MAFLFGRPMLLHCGNAKLTTKFKSRLWLKGILVVLLIVGLCSLSIALYCIPLTWQITYRMEKKFAISQLDRMLNMVAVKYLEIEQYRRNHHWISIHIGNMGWPWIPWMIPSCSMSGVPG